MEDTTKERSTTSCPLAQGVQVSLCEVLRDIHDAEVRRGGPEHVQLVAVSKTKPNEMILEAYHAGQRVFGENYVQELVRKAAELPEDICWHMIGHLQSNKVGHVAAIRNVVVETIDSVSLARKLDAARARTTHGPIPVFVQVNTGAYPTKSGVSETSGASGALVEPVRELVAAVRGLPNLALVGLMTIGSETNSSGDFHTLAAVRNNIDPGLALSMGMSHDFTLAVAAGADYVRVGSKIFGTRNYTT